jgi:hypothetical protein
MNEARAERWAAGWATAGTAAWACIAVLARMGIARFGVIELLFLFGPLVIVPLGMELGRLTGGPGSGLVRWFEEMAQILQPLGAVLVVLSIWLPPGNRAALAAIGWIVVCALTAAGGAAELVRILFGGSQSLSGTETSAPSRFAAIAASIARLDLAVAGAWLLASRMGLRPLGIQEPIGLLTAVHFHFAGFATAMIASATLRFPESGAREKFRQWIVLAVILLPAVVATGFVISPILKMAAAVAFSASVAALAVVIWLCASRAEAPPARLLLRLGAGAVFLGMALSCIYAVADWLNSDALPIPFMASTHGVLNALGFCLLVLLGWLVEWHEKQ